MSKKLSLSIFLKYLLFMVVQMFCIVFFAGCAAENPNPLAVENLHGEPPKQEFVSMELDARGIINGIYQPGDITPYEPNYYPVNYTGDWRLINAGTRSNHYTITTDKVGARVDIVATLSRAVFDFWDYEFYDNPGRVSFYIDEQPLGTFNLARSDAEGQKILNYQVATQKNTVATITMILETGRVTISGYLFNFLDKRFPY
jgi:hypothetical protein